jgi:hypothetical protein
MRMLEYNEMMSSEYSYFILLTSDFVRDIRPNENDKLLLFPL